MLNTISHMARKQKIAIPQIRQIPYFLDKAVVIIHGSMNVFLHFAARSNFVDNYCEPCYIVRKVFNRQQ